MVYRRQADGCNQGVGPRRMAYRRTDLDRSAVRLDSPAARVRAQIEEMDWLTRGRRVATRYDRYARRCLGFLYLAATWIWLKAKLHATKSRAAECPKRARALVGFVGDA